MSTFKPTLAVNADFSKIKYPVYASPKLDGIRCSIVDGRALSRTLKPIPNKHIYEQLSCSELDGLDGELIVGEPTSPTCYTDSVSNVMAFDKVPAYTYYVFDCHDIPQATYRHRRDCLIDTLGNWGGLPLQICLLEQNLLANEDDMLAYEAGCVAEGYEGIILRSPEAPYKYGRSTVNEGYLLKVKRFEDSEAEIIGFEEEMFNGNEAQTNELGRTKRSTAQSGLIGKGTLGAFLVRDIHTGVEFSVGTGLTALERKSHWLNQDTSLGGLIKYKFFPVGVKDKPRHPVYLGMRDRRDLSRSHVLHGRYFVIDQHYNTDQNAQKVNLFSSADELIAFHADGASAQGLSMTLAPRLPWLTDADVQTLHKAVEEDIARRTAHRIKS